MPRCARHCIGSGGPLPVLRRPLDAEVIIVGAGLAGAATAYHLRRLTRGRCRLLVVEREATAGEHSSGRCAAIVRESADVPGLQRMLSEGASVLWTGCLAPFRQTGSMLLGLGNERASKYFPRASGSGRWCPFDGTIDVAALLRRYLDRQWVEYSTTVLGWDAVRGCLEVLTDRGVIRCHTLVNAAGPWAGEIGRLPLTPLNRHLFVSTEMDWVGRDWPVIWEGAAGLYFRPESGGLLLCCCDETPARPGDYAEEGAVLEDLAFKLATLQPGLGDIAIRRAWVGQRVFAPDRRFVIGFDPRGEQLNSATPSDWRDDTGCGPKPAGAATTTHAAKPAIAAPNPQVFHIAGLGGHGVTASYAVGRLAARMILRGPSEDAGLFDPRRLVQEPAPAAVRSGPGAVAATSPPWP